MQRTPAPGATGALANAKLLDALFGNDAVRNKRNTEAVEVGAEPAGLGPRRCSTSRAHQLPLAEVKDRRCASAWSRKQAAALARKEGEARAGGTARRRPTLP